MAITLFGYQARKLEPVFSYSIPRGQWGSPLHFGFSIPLCYIFEVLPLSSSRRLLLGSSVSDTQVFGSDCRSLACRIPALRHQFLGGALYHADNSGTMRLIESFSVHVLLAMASITPSIADVVPAEAAVTVAPTLAPLISADDLER